jgi:tetrahydromethanopterin S-methyltransferase subunit A
MNEEWKQKTDESIIDLKTRMAVNEAGLKDVKDDIKSIRDDTKWVRRAISGAIISAIVGGVIALFFFLLKSNLIN